MSSAPVTYSQRPDTTPQTELSALANIYKYVLDCHSKKEATHPGSPDDGTEFKEDSANEHIIPDG